MFKNLKLAFKIGGGFALILVLSIIIALVAIINLNSVSGKRFPKQPGVQHHRYDQNGYYRR